MEQTPEKGSVNSLCSNMSRKHKYVLAFYMIFQNSDGAGGWKSFLIKDNDPHMKAHNRKVTQIWKKIKVKIKQGDHFVPIICRDLNSLWASDYSHQLFSIISWGLNIQNFCQILMLKNQIFYFSFKMDIYVFQCFFYI